MGRNSIVAIFRRPNVIVLDNDPYRSVREKMNENYGYEKNIRCVFDSGILNRTPTVKEIRGLLPKQYIVTYSPLPTPHRRPRPIVPFSANIIKAGTCPASSIAKAQLPVA